MSTIKIIMGANDQKRYSIMLTNSCVIWRADSKCSNTKVISPTNCSDVYFKIYINIQHV